MRLGLYTFAAVALIAIVGALTYTINPNNYAIELMGINFNFPIALWLVLPMILLFLFTLLHMFFHGMKNYFILKKWKKDTASLEDALYWSLVNEPKEEKYTISDLRSSAVLLSKSKIDVSDNIEGLTPRLSRVVNIIQKIKNGEYVDLKENKLSKVFNDGNPILIQNRLNRLESDDKFVEEVMRSSTSYSKAVQAEALRIFVSKVDFVQARKYAKIFDVESFLLMLNRLTPEDNLNLTSEILTDFVHAMNLKCEDYLKIAVITKKYFKPDENLTLFREYQAKDEKAQNAYLYLLFEYELLDQVSAYLDEHEKDEFIKFRALYTLKKEHNGYKLEDIIDVDSLCQPTKLY